MGSRTLAAWVAKGVPGLREVNNSIVLTSRSVRPDAQIRRDILAGIARDPWIHRSELDVRVKRGQVRLAGVVGSPVEKTRANEVAWVAGVRTVDLDGIRIKPSLGSSMERRTVPQAIRSDVEIQRSVEAALAADPRVAQSGLNVSVRQGVATLAGRLDSFAATQAAEQDARNTVGVIAVRNDLRAEARSRPDAVIAREVEEALDRGLPQDVRSQVGATVHEGVVTLTGEVISPFQRWRARDAASRVNGVVAVGDRLGVAAAPDGDALKKRIESAFRRDPHLGFPEDLISVSVQGRTARLSGRVSGWDERWAATRDAFGAGADEVVNSLNVTTVGVGGRTYTSPSYSERSPIGPGFPLG